MESLLRNLSQNALSGPAEIVVMMTALSILPLLVVSVTCFTRFVIVFSLLRYALGLQQTPPNIIIIALSFFMSLYAMSDTLGAISEKAIEPYMAGQADMQKGMEESGRILKKFMISQIEREDLEMVVSLSKHPMPASVEESHFLDVVPAFLLSELRTAFKIGFVVFLPFLLVDLVVSSILMALGMIMLPPMTISLPIKIMLFVLIDGWSLVFRSLIASVGG